MNRTFRADYLLLYSLSFRNVRGDATTAKTFRYQSFDGRRTLVSPASFPDKTRCSCRPRVSRDKFQNKRSHSNVATADAYKLPRLIVITTTENIHQYPRARLSVVQKFKSFRIYIIR